MEDIKSISDVADKNLSPSEYFDTIKGLKNNITDEALVKVYENCLEILNKYKNNIKDIKLISSSSYTLKMTMYNELKAGLLIRINDKFENIRVRTDVNSKILNSNEIANRLTNIQQEYQKYL